MDICSLNYLFKRVLGFRTSNLDEVANFYFEIAPMEKKNSPPAIFLKNNLDEITSVAKGTTWEQEKLRIYGGMVTHASTRCYQLEKVKLLKGHFYKDMFRYKIGNENPYYVTSKKIDVIENGVLACTNGGNTWFGHWLTDDLPLKLAAQELGKTFSVSRKPYSNEAEYLKILGLPNNPISYAYFNQLMILQDFSQNSYKHKRYTILRNQIIENTPVKSHIGVYLRRGKSGATRVLVNEAEVEAFLMKNGFKILEAEQCSLKDLLGYCLGAKYVVGVEGSQLAHCVYTLSIDGVLISLTPANKFLAVHKDYADCIGYRYGFLVGKANKEGFLINIDELKKLLEIASKPKP